MTSEEREQMNQLCQRIQFEKDATQFSELVAQLSELLERKEKRFEPTRQRLGTQRET